MKYCSNCGTELNDEDNVCYNCGAPAKHRVGGRRTVNDDNSDIKTAIKVLLVISCFAWAWLFLIPLAWMIPMTVHYFNCVKENKPVETGFKICTLLFVNTIAGIMMLCDNN